jgi:hypothetical protein
VSWWQRRNVDEQDARGGVETLVKDASKPIRGACPGTSQRDGAAITTARTRMARLSGIARWSA